MNLNARLDLRCSLNHKRNLMRRILAVMADGREHSSYEIAMLIQPDQFSRPFWWSVAAVLESETFEVIHDRNLPKRNSVFEARHDGHKWIYRIKQGLF